MTASGLIRRRSILFEAPIFSSTSFAFRLGTYWNAADNTAKIQLDRLRCRTHSTA